MIFTNFQQTLINIFNPYLNICNYVNILHDVESLFFFSFSDFVFGSVKQIDY